MSRDGRYQPVVIHGEPVRAFVPPPLPPDPPLRIDSRLLGLALEAQARLGELNGAASILPSRALFLYAYVRKEALLSSQIEGTQSSLSDLLLFEVDEAPGVPIDDVREVSNYVAAVEHGMARLSEIPLCLRLLRELHEILLRSGRGAGKAHGTFRRSEVWVGGSRPSTASFIPPPWQEVEPALAQLERWLHDDSDPTPPLIRAGLAHVQFETIHPFLDGNGRIGRLLITLLFVAARLLREPILYLSLFFKTRRDEYYQRLDAVRAEGDWEGWTEFFLTGVRDVAGQAADAAQRLLAVAEQDRARVDAAAGLGRAAISVHRVLQFAQERPLLKSAVAAERTGLSRPTVDSALAALEGLGILEEVTGRRWGRIYAYRAYLDVLGEGTAPLSRAGAQSVA